MGLLTGKTALVTGAARGIGKAIALKFAAEGANVAFTDLVIDENGQATEAEIAAFGVKAKGYASNAADFAQTEEVVKQVKEDFGSIDILVNNAGITKDGLMLRMTEAQWDAVIAVNLKSVGWIEIARLQAIAQEMGAKGIRANAIAPGFIETAMTAALSDDVRAEWCKKIPLRRGGTPEDVANVALFLASDLSSYVSGQVIQIDGGMNM